jgi:spectinomycin phosphotransferase
MLTPPNLSFETIVAMVGDVYQRQASHVSFLPIGADVNSAVYRVDTSDGEAYLLKLRRIGFDPIAVEIPAFLHAQGLDMVMAPLPTAQGQLWASEHNFVWILYPFFEGSNGYEAPLSDAQWSALGRTLRGVHGAVLPLPLASRVPRERYSARWREIVRVFDAQVGAFSFNDPLAQDLATFWATKHVEIGAMVERTERLGQTLAERADAFALCHGDLHPGNVLLSAHDTLTIVDWDTALFAPKEHDLMLLGGGVSPTWNDPRQDAQFFEGYGRTELDPVALSYYTYERIIADLGAFGEQIFNVEGGEEDREWGLRMVKGNFLPGEMVESAHRRYAQIPMDTSR